MRRLDPRNKNSRGFTVVELTIATGVFSIILLLAMAGFIQIGKLFYKGVTITRTNDVSKQTLNSLKNDVSFDILTTSYAPQISPLTPTPVSPRRYFCAGTNRYTYILHQKLDADAEATQMNQSGSVSGWNKFALLKDTVVSGCPDPFNGSGAIIPPSSSGSTVTELLGDKMRLSSISIQQLPSPNDKLYTISIKVAYGDDSVLQSPTSDNPECITDNTVGSSFCFVSDLRSIVRKGL
ncbi:MAG TPA: prepilin-type N-terminal cleavage/methylation domain-containing protein [Candidatus Saccharimonadales bacterium]|nr:prepilin-type N-terminal cleavage/methylation domain-containing protein [Candidatus Saccharimonadales bacterium]